MVYRYKQENPTPFTVPSYPKLDLDRILVLIKVNVEKAMDSFLKGAVRGSTLVMVDVGLVYWEIRKKDEGVRMYKRVAELGYDKISSLLDYS
ncbi:hypothetical protein Tco_1489114 [Tanacetum coccineum]